jgi:hypothetical protein
MHRAEAVDFEWDIVDRGQGKELSGAHRRHGENSGGDR